MYNFKEVLITCLVLVGAVTILGAPSQNPQCKPPKASSTDLPAHFVFFVDYGLEPELLSRILYLVKAMSCEIPINKKILSLVIAYGKGQSMRSENMTSDGIPDYLFNNQLQQMDENEEDQCAYFAHALSMIPRRFIERHDNVQFVVPIVGEQPGCSMLNVFQTYFSNNSMNTENMFFHGILINAKLTEKNKQSVRMHIPDIKSTINLNSALFRASEDTVELEKMKPILISFDTMMQGFLNGTRIHDWDPIATTTTTTTTSSTTTTSPSPTTSSTQKPDEEDEDGEEPMMAFDKDDEVLDMLPGVVNITDDVGENDWNTTSSEMNVTSTSSGVEMDFTSTTPGNKMNGTFLLEESNSTLTAWNLTASLAPEASLNGSDAAEADEKFIEESDYDDLDLMMAKGAIEDESSPEPIEKEKKIDAQLVILLLLLLLLIWFFCLFLCLVWMFYCAKRKRNNIEENAAAVESQQNEPLIAHKKRVNPIPLPPPPPPNTTSSNQSSESDESDDEWKKIQPYYKNVPTEAPKSETESVKQPIPAVRCNPVEVSEFEDPKNDDDVVDRPRHGYLKPKKAADLYFD